jgi:hypothetical protein
MADDKIFAAGLFYKAPHERAPEFVKGSISIKVEEFTAFLQEHVSAEGWVNISVKERRGGKLYCELDQYKRREEPAEPNYPSIEKADINPDDIPF